MKALVGYTGFVGGNIDRKADFDARYNSKNIADAFGTRPDLLVYAGLRAEKYLANKQPDKDLESIREAFDNIRKIDPKELVLISTSDVYKVPVGVDEDTPVDTEERRIIDECYEKAKARGVSRGFHRPPARALRCRHQEEFRL